MPQHYPLGLYNWSLAVWMLKWLESLDFTASITRCEFMKTRIQGKFTIETCGEISVNDTSGPSHTARMWATRPVWRRATGSCCRTLAWNGWNWPVISSLFWWGKNSTEKDLASLSGEMIGWCWHESYVQKKTPFSWFIKIQKSRELPKTKSLKESLGTTPRLNPTFDKIHIPNDYLIIYFQLATIQ